MVAPVLEQGKKARMIYLPKGDNWIDYWTKESFEGGQYIIKEAPLEICPIYIKEGSIIPNFPELSYIGEKDIKTLILDIYTVKEGEFEYHHYQDDGESFEYKDGKYNLYSIKVNNSHKLNITIDLIKNGYNKIYDEVQINLNGTNKLLRKFENNKVVIDIDKN
ncbi:hypothetical protein SDC9_125183 [bioreactor metagenome]